MGQENPSTDDAPICDASSSRSDAASTDNPSTVSAAEDSEANKQGNEDVSPTSKAQTADADKQCTRDCQLFYLLILVKQAFL
jgi:hypothetical protein